jgi:four helix bundle protein
MTAKIQRFEDFIAWQKARTLTASVYQVTNQGGFARDYGLRDQIRRSAVSVMANIAEGFERSGASQFQHFLAVAKASCAELRSHLYVALDVGYLDQAHFERLITQAVEVGHIVGGLRASVQRRQAAM